LHLSDHLQRLVVIQLRQDQLLALQVKWWNAPLLFFIVVDWRRANCLNFVRPQHHVDYSLEDLVFLI
jgi:hypothetical protein